MDLIKALEKQPVLRTEYGAGVKVLNGLFRRSVLKRQRYLPGGGTIEDVIHERSWNLGPVNVVHRSREPFIAGNSDYELALTLFGLFAFSNDKEMLIKFKAGVGAGILRHVLALTPAAPASAAVDVNMDARAGVRLNVTKLLRDLKSEQPDDGESHEDDLS